MREHWWKLRKAQLRRSSRPVIVGPFRGEVGFEALYWVPFLRALDVDPSRMIVVTRGGAHLWYPAERHVELYEVRDPKDVRTANLHTHRRTRMLKQMDWDRWDRDVIRDVKRQLKTPTAAVIHPSVMYRALEDYWLLRRGLGWLFERVAPTTLPPVEGEGLTLPDDFVAVRFYHRVTYPPSAATRTVAVETVKRLASQHHVIVLNADVHTDEHTDVPIPEMENVTQLKGQSVATAANNLALQSAILCRARAFVGTYGGLAQLALMYGCPSVSFYTDWHGTSLAHKHYADALALQFGAPAHVLRVTDAPLLQAAVPPLTFERAHRVKSDTSTDPVFAPKG